MEKEKLQALIQKYLRGEATAEEKAIIAQWYDSFPDDEPITHIVAGRDDAEENLRMKMLQRLRHDLQFSETPSLRSPVRKLFTRWTVAAAAILCFIAGGIYLLKDSNSKTDTAKASEKVNPLQPGDIAPGGNKAVLQLADGRTIELDTASTGFLANQGAAQINLVTKGQVSYQSAAEINAPVFYNTLLTPAGGQYNITLPDGTRVWLNAVSSIYFPTSFNGDERVVKITGEAYFEVAPDKTKPFKVQYENAEVTVLGTHFNINAYTDEKDARVTLLEGNVQVRQGNKLRQLKPGQQAITHASDLQLATGVDVAEVIAWKDGYFEFSSTDIETMMRQAARWYNIGVSYQGEKPRDRFTGRISRNVNLSEFLKILAYSDVNFKMEDRQIILLPN